MSQNHGERAALRRGSQRSKGALPGRGGREIDAGLLESLLRQTLRAQHVSCCPTIDGLSGSDAAADAREAGFQARFDRYRTRLPSCALNASGQEPFSLVL